LKTNTSFLKKIGSAAKKIAVKDIVSTSLKAVRNSAEIDKNIMTNANIKKTTEEITDFILSVKSEQRNKTPKQLQNQYNFLRAVAEHGSSNPLSRIIRQKAYNTIIATQANKIDFPHAKDAHVKIKNNELLIAHATKKSKTGYAWVPLDDVMQKQKSYMPMTKEQIKKFNSTPNIRNIIADVINGERHGDEKQGDFMEKILHQIDESRNKGKAKEHDDTLSDSVASTADMSDDDYSRK
jgi:hypothetical protein